MYKISKKFMFSAAHKLEGLQQGHPCLRLHGHNYEIEIVLKSNILNDVGMVKDYRELDDFKRWLDATFDHQFLNEVLPDLVNALGLPKGRSNATAENLAYLIYQIWKPKFGNMLFAVIVKEGQKTSAEYYED